MVVALSDKDPVLRDALEASLVQITGMPVAELLAEMLSDSQSNVRCAAARALGRNGEISAMAPLVKSLQHPDAELRLAAADSLDILNWKPDRIGLVVDFNIGRRQWDNCIEIGAPAVIPLIRLLADNNKEISAAAEDALVKIGKLSLTPLVEKLKDDNPVMRDTAARILDRTGYPPTLSPIIPPAVAVARAPSAIVVPGRVSSGRKPVLVPYSAGLRDPRRSAEDVRAMVVVPDRSILASSSLIKSIIASRKVRPLGNRKRLCSVEGKDCHAYIALFSEQAEAERYYEAFVRYAQHRHPPFVIEVLAAHLRQILFPEKYAFALPYFSAESRPGYNEWAKEAILACNNDLGQHKYTAGKYEILQGAIESVILWNILLPSGFAAGTGEGRELLSDPPGMGYKVPDPATDGTTAPGKPCPSGPWISVLYNLSKLRGADYGEAAVKELQDLVGASRLAGCVIHGGIFKEKYWSCAIHSSGDEQADQIELAVLGSTLESAETKLALDITPVLKDAPAEIQALSYQGYVAEGGKYVGSPGRIGLFKMAQGT